MIRNDDRRYGAVAQALHWLIAGLVIFMLGLGWYMEDLPRGPHQAEMYQLHASLGVTLLALVILRLAWRLYTPPPPLPASMPAWERKAARGSHFLLYALLLIQPVIGILQAGAADLQLQIWGVLPLPAVLAPNEPLADTLFGVHGLVATLLGALVLVHTGAALRHHFWLKDDVMRRMLPGPLPERSAAPPGRRSARP